MQKFKTNLKCDGCVAKVSPSLNSLGVWRVDLKDKDKILTLETPVEKQKVIALFQQAGYRAEPISEP